MILIAQYLFLYSIYISCARNEETGPAQLIFMYFNFDYCGYKRFLPWRVREKGSCVVAIGLQSLKRSLFVINNQLQADLNFVRTSE